MARDVIVEWASYERKAWLPRGFLWNDHAIAKRVFVLAKFWRHYRTDPSYRPEIGRSIFQLVVRSGQFLAKPDHFAYATNHGLMQNLALWHLSLAFPTIPIIKEYQRLAFDRVNAQIAFYVNHEGVVLEHSAGYQKVGLDFLRMAMGYLKLLDQEIPHEWKQRYQQALGFYGQIMRPNGSLPAFGDTNENPKEYPVGQANQNTEQDEVNSNDASIPQQNSIYPLAGYAIWWNGLKYWPHEQELNQTVVAWSYFPGHAHKHADEMSVLFWGSGQTWWTNVGYWPYGVEGRSNAESWEGSNAPHLTNEVGTSHRVTKLALFGSSETTVGIELERNGPGSFVARRQIFHLRPNLWLVLDCFSGNEQEKVSTIWTTSRDVLLRKASATGTYTLESKKKRSTLSTFFLGSAQTEVKICKGSFTPFAGWQVVNGVPHPSYAIVVEQPANHSWFLTAWSLKGRHPTSSVPARMISWKQHTQWEISLPTEVGDFRIWRDDRSVSFQDSRSLRIPEVLRLRRGPDTSSELLQIQRSLFELEAKYPRFRSLVRYRVKMTYFLLALFLMQEFSFALCRYKLRQGFVKVRTASVLAWIAAGVWLNLFYFV